MIRQHLFSKPLVAGDLESPIWIERSTQNPFKLNPSASRVSSVQYQFCQVDSCHSVFRRYLNCAFEVCARPCHSATQPARQLVLQPSEHAQWPGSMISRVDGGRPLQGSFCFQDVNGCTTSRFEGSQQSKIYARSKVPLNSFRS